MCLKWPLQEANRLECSDNLVFSNWNIKRSTFGINDWRSGRIGISIDIGTYGRDKFRCRFHLRLFVRSIGVCARGNRTVGGLIANRLQIYA